MMCETTTEATTGLQAIFDQDGFLNDNSCPENKVIERQDLKIMFNKALSYTSMHLYARLYKARAGNTKSPPGKVGFKT